MTASALVLAAALAAAPSAVERLAQNSPREDRAGAILKGLDKFSGRVSTFEAGVGEAVRYKRLTVTVRACRAAADEEDAVAFLEIDDRAGRVFSGWMYAADPALSALDHPRYDVWVAACSTVSGEAS